MGGGGNGCACTGVLGEASAADSGEESAISMGGGGLTAMDAARLGSAVVAEPGSMVDASVISEFAGLESSRRLALNE
jgi:hypothetical protein